MSIVAKFKVNSETTDALSAGDSYTLADNSKLKVIEVIPVESSESAGADQVTFTFDCSGVTKKMCGDYCASTKAAKCTGSTQYTASCSSVGCNTTCWGRYSGWYNSATGCNAAHDDVCVGATGKTSDIAK